MQHCRDSRRSHVILQLFRPVLHRILKRNVVSTDISLLALRGPDNAVGLPCLCVRTTAADRHGPRLFWRVLFYEIIAKYCDEYVSLSGCLSVCLSVCLSAHISRILRGRVGLSPSFCCLLPWLGSALAPLRYVMFSGRVDDAIFTRLDLLCVTCVPSRQERDNLNCCINTNEILLNDNDRQADGGRNMVSTVCLVLGRSRRAGC